MTELLSIFIVFVVFASLLILSTAIILVFVAFVIWMLVPVIRWASKSAQKMFAP